MAALARWVLAVVLVSGGVAGLVLPGLPGAPLLFLGLLVAAWAEEFAYVGWKTLTVVGMMGLATYPVDLAATLVGVRGFGASRRAAAGAMLGLVVGRV
jgi:uncharacterized protein YqgC (DUF456 family)